MQVVQHMVERNYLQVEGLLNQVVQVQEIHLLQILLKEIQVDMLKGEADLTKERLFITGMPAPSTEGAEGLEGEISVKATRNAGLAGAALACMLQPGEWLSDLRLSVGGERVQDLSYEMAPDQRLLDLTVGVLAQVFLGFGGHLCCHRVL